MQGKEAELRLQMCLMARVIGRLNGAMERYGVMCPECQRPMNRHKQTCQIGYFITNLLLEVVVSSKPIFCNWVVNEKAVEVAAEIDGNDELLHFEEQMREKHRHGTLELFDTEARAREVGEQFGTVYNARRLADEPAI